MPQQCDPGTYASTQGSSFCNDCERGFYCPQGTSDYSTYVCPPGHWCPNGTSYGEQYKCPPGTYSPSTGLHFKRQCLDCIEGMACTIAGLSAPDVNCSAGHYCGKGSNTSTPVDYSFGSVCPAGYYCPEGKKNFLFYTLKLDIIVLYFLHFYKSQKKLEN